MRRRAGARPRARAASPGSPPAARRRALRSTRDAVTRPPARPGAKAGARSSTRRPGRRCRAAGTACAASARACARGATGAVAPTTAPTSAARLARSPSPSTSRATCSHSVAALGEPRSSTSAAPGFDVRTRTKMPAPRARPQMGRQRVEAHVGVDRAGVDAEARDGRRTASAPRRRQRLGVGGGGDVDVAALAVGDARADRCSRACSTAALQRLAAGRAEALEARELRLDRDAGGARRVDQPPALRGDRGGGALGGRPVRGRRRGGQGHSRAGSGSSPRTIWDSRRATWRARRSPNARWAVVSS